MELKPEWLEFKLMLCVIRLIDYYSVPEKQNYHKYLSNS